jgi:hypothetical protein
VRAFDAMFVWTPANDPLYAACPLRGQIAVTTIPEGRTTKPHPLSFGACGPHWSELDDAGRAELLQEMIIHWIHVDEIPVDAVRAAVMVVDEYATFPFSTENNVLVSADYPVRSFRGRSLPFGLRELG